MRRIEDDIRLVTWIVVAGLLGFVLVAVALLGLAARGDVSENAGRHEPTHRVDFDVHRGRSSPTTVSPTTTPPVPAPPTTVPRPAPSPVSISVPGVGISSTLVPLGLDPDGTLQVPEDFALAGWYTGRPAPGEIGPSVIVGHVDSKRGPAAFYRLREVQPGQTVEVSRADGSTATFRVVGKEEHDKDEFPTARVYGPTAAPELRLITCGGRFDRSIGHYEDNIVVFAELTGIAPPRP